MENKKKTIWSFSELSKWKILENSRDQAIPWQQLRFRAFVELAGIPGTPGKEFHVHVNCARDIRVGKTSSFSKMGRSIALFHSAL